MRPSQLNALFSPITTLPGIGPRLAPLYVRLAGERLVDLLWHRPTGLVDRRPVGSAQEAATGTVATLRIVVEQHFPPPTLKRPYRVRCHDGVSSLTLVFFHAKEDWLRRQLPEGQPRLISGTVERFNGEVQLTHPDYIVPPERNSEIPSIEAVYPLTAGLTSKMVGKTIRAALERVPELPEWQDQTWLSRQAWPTWNEAVLRCHNLASDIDLSPDAPWRRRLAFDELLANQLALALVRLHLRKVKGRILSGDGHLREKVTRALPYSLTGAQHRSLSEIYEDMREPYRMLRLLQGDVGSGKTIVALMAMLNAVETGAQAALLAPTEILARQHMESIAPLAETCGVRVTLLTGRDKGKQRDAILAGLADGSVAIAIGTHALIQPDVVFHDLALAVIDEQHRFGVQQRLDLASKGTAVDVLAMTATPIPRTLLLTSYGDMDSSRLDEKPPGRQPVATRAVPVTRLEEIVDGLKRAVAGGARVYWVCPLVEESENVDLAAAEDRHRHLADIFGHRAGLVHGRMKGTDKDKVMKAFSVGDLDILVSTTVIEVGVNVPEATIMVIEHAERFGLAQLHQLRGRVGRGDSASSCMLLYDAPLSETAKSRLEVMRSTDDGFVIAEEDLRLRGGGEILGTRQSGLPEFKMADLAVDGDLLAAARDDARLILERDPELATERGNRLRTLLYLFDRDSAIRTLRSG
jgi:ATP-dependent DNA helicase RecG